jgi:hypothetical protein
MDMRMSMHMRTSIPTFQPFLSSLLPLVNPHQRLQGANINSLARFMRVRQVHDADFFVEGLYFVGSLGGGVGRQVGEHVWKGQQQSTGQTGHSVGLLH